MKYVIVSNLSWTTNESALCVWKYIICSTNSGADLKQKDELHRSVKIKYERTVETWGERFEAIRTHYCLFNDAQIPVLQRFLDFSTPNICMYFFSLMFARALFGIAIPFRPSEKWRFIFSLLSMRQTGCRNFLMCPEPDCRDELLCGAWHICALEATSPVTVHGRLHWSSRTESSVD